MIGRTTVIGAAVLALGVSAAAAGPLHKNRAACTPRIVNGVTYNCGPATAKLDKFPGVTFRKGTCIHRPTLFFLALGTYTTNRRTNNGKQYLALSVAGPLSHPQGGGVNAFNRGKHWTGRITSFRGGTGSGTFTAKGVTGSRGTAHGSYHC